MLDEYTLNEEYEQDNFDYLDNHFSYLDIPADNDYDLTFEGKENE